MEKELRKHILHLSQNADWVKAEMPAMIEKGMQLLSSEKAQQAIKEYGRDKVISEAAFKVIDQYY